MTVRTVPRRPSAAGWLVDRAALEAALIDLGLRLPVTVRLTTGWRKAGVYRTRDEGHVVLLSGRHPIERANRTLWHELTHAVQAERDFSMWGLVDHDVAAFIMRLSSRRRYEDAGLDYDTNALEVEAREVADTLGGTAWLLVAA